MAILGFQLVSTLIGASLLSKVISHFSFGRYLLCSGLVRYLHPTNKQLKEAAGIVKPKEKPKKPRRHKEFLENGITQESFTVPKSVPLALDAEPVNPVDVVPLHFYTEYQWLVDFALCACLVFIANEVAYEVVMGEAARFNLSLVWCLLGLMFAWKTLLSLTRLYFRASEGGELMIVLTSGFFFLVLAMAALILPEEQLQLDIEAAHANLTLTAKKYNEQINPGSGLVSEGPISQTTLRACLAMSGALMGALFAYPGLRYGKMYLDSLKYADNALTTFLLHLNFFLPLGCALFWVTPLTKELVKFRVGRTQVTERDLASLRLHMVMGLCLLRLFLTGRHLQAYLNLAQTRLQILRKEAGRITNLELQRIVARIFYCLCVAALQYLIPVLLLLFLTCLYKSLGEFHWTAGRMDTYLPLMNFSRSNPMDTLNLTATLGEDVQASVADWTFSIGAAKALFTGTLYRGMLGFFVWWTLVCMQVTSVFGLVYHNYVEQ